MVWAERSFGFTLHSDSSVGSQSKAAKRATTDSLPELAVTTTFQELQLFETQVFEAETLVLQCWSGHFACAGHAVMRDHDLQSSYKLCLSPSAVLGQSHDVKGRQVPLWWSALRHGISGRDWGQEWIRQLAEAGLPGRHSIMMEPDDTLSRFLPCVESFSDGQIVLRTLLLKKSYTRVAACRTSLYSLRHTMVTAWRQLGHESSRSGELGRWEPGCHALAQ